MPTLTTGRTSCFTRWGVALLALACACKPKPIPNDPNAHVPLATAPEWNNWSENLVHKPAQDGQKYYFSPTTRAELQTIVQMAVEAGVSVRVTGQRHSQPPLVADDNRQAPPAKTIAWVVDLSCYADLGPEGKDDMVLDAANKRLTVNAGIREDAVDAFLTDNNLMLKTVTAGGFFSIGGMTAIDVNGATIDAPIFAETASAFEIMGPDGVVTRVDAQSPGVEGWSAIQFARVSLGALGVVTSVTIDVAERPYATTLEGSRARYTLNDEAAFVERYKELLAGHDRLESFYNPYTAEFLALAWNKEPNPSSPVPNSAGEVASACTFAEKDKPGAPFEVPVEERVAEKTEEYVQVHGNREEAKLLIDFALRNIEKQVDAAAKKHSDLWLTAAARVVFMSYFIELPGVDDAGLSRAWKGIDAITQRVTQSDEFLVAGPIEFRFIRGGNSALAGTYSTTPGSLFINLDLIAFVKPVSASEYPEAMLKFFADIEREWIALGGWPHNGKMYGFFDPAGAADNFSAPFNPAFLADLARRRGDRVQAFESYRRTRDPKGLFCNDYLRELSLCGSAP
ncbi:MAG: D-arabinono-1,4-lactone oxidase [Myxococcota bacterium]